MLNSNFTFLLGVHHSLKFGKRFQAFGDFETEIETYIDDLPIKQIYNTVA